jgi:hypothetical protein
MPTLEQNVEREPGKPRRIISMLTFFSEDEKNLNDADMISSIRDHWDPNGQGYYRPDPDNEGSFICVYIESVQKDDSDASAKKRHIVEVEILGRDFVPE